MASMPHLTAIDWDYAERMHHADKGGGGDVYFTYDSAGQRIRKIYDHSGIVEEHFYLGGWEIYRRHRIGTLDLERESLHVMDDTKRIALVETKTVDSEHPGTLPQTRHRYQLDNHLGSASLELDESSNVISYEEYHPFGTTSFRSTDGGAEVSAKRYRYTGKERDDETGLYYYGARCYAAWLGRWTGCDPSVEDGWNLYLCVKNNPVTLSDPNGEQSSYPEFVKLQVESEFSEIKQVVSGKVNRIFKEMAKGMPIRDASAHLSDKNPLVHQKFLGAERNLLRNQGWKFDKATDLWMPPQ